MGSKKSNLIDDELERLSRDVYGYLHYQYDKEKLIANKDDIGLQLLKEDAPNISNEYLLFRRLKTFAGKYGSIPLLVEGGYMDQPYITLRVIEACINGESRYEDFLRQEENVQPIPQNPTDWFKGLSQA